MATKICCTCKKEKPLTCFSRNKRSKDGFKEYCKECASIKSAQYREKNKPDINRRKRQAYEESKKTAHERTEKELRMKSKVCTVCKVEKPVTDFYKRGNGGFFNYCKDCANSSARRYYLSNWRAIHDKKIEYDKAHRSEISAYNKQYYMNHFEEVKQRTKDWVNNNPEKSRESGVFYAQRARSRKRGTKASFTRIDWKCCKVYFGHRCAYCGKEIKKATQDHVIPVEKDGDYTVTNVVPACMSCNSSKGNKSFDEWYPTQPFYSKEREEDIKAYFELVRHANTERAT